MRLKSALKRIEQRLGYTDVMDENIRATLQRFYPDASGAELDQLFGSEFGRNGRRVAEALRDAIFAEIKESYKSHE